MLSLAVAYAEAHGYGVVALGNNLEEAGAYPDNEEQLYIQLNDLMPYVTQNGVAVKIVQPVGHLMKHEVVRAGTECGAPYDVTWSCYHDGPVHCGDCGPCYMRQKAFERNQLDDPAFNHLHT